MLVFVFEKVDKCMSVSVVVSESKSKIVSVGVYVWM